MQHTAKAAAKLGIAVFDITKKFPLPKNSFDGVLCFGTLHLFPSTVLRKIIAEIDRVLKPGGSVIMDFPTNIKRVRFDRKPYVIKGEPNYSTVSGQKMLRKSFSKYVSTMTIGHIPPESYPNANPPYTYSSDFILYAGTKKQVTLCHYTQRQSR